MHRDPVGEFLDSAQQSGLLSVDEAAAVSRELCESGNDTKRDVAARLVEKKLITPFQAEQLLSGHGNECVLSGRYFIRQKLGEGAMGAVYLADDRKLERAVAIKVLPAQSATDAGAVARFQREAKALAKVSHPNVVQAYDSDEDAGRPFLVMEYAEGMNLRDLLRATGRIAPAQAADFIYQATLGLQNAHEKGLVHRDVKPGNLLLASNGQVKILDLGLARFLQDQVGDATLTREGTGMGTPDYMPPEQFRDARHVDARSDIYSLGCTLYHLLAGRVPFPGTSMSEKYAAHEEQSPQPLEEVCPDVPAGLALAVQRMMARRPADRFQSAREVAEALFPHVAGSSNSIQQIKATASWHGSQLGLSVVPSRFRSRRRLAIGSAVTAVAMAVIALSLWASGTLGPLIANLQPPIPGDPNVLTVAKDGSGQFRTIAEALAKVDHPDMTIRVLDSEVYEETNDIRDPGGRAGLSIESLHKAILTIPQGSTRAVGILNVPRVKIRGFVVEVHRSKTVGLGLTGYCPGTILDGLEFRGSQTRTTGIGLESAIVDVGEAPIVIQDCTFDGVAQGIEVFGQTLTTNESTPLRGLLVQNNVFRGNIVAILMAGRLNRVVIVSNRVQNFSETGILIVGLMEGSGQLLIANNTLRGLRNCIQITDLQLAVASVEIVNNLIVAERGLDIAFLGTAAEVIRPWSVSHNLRYARKPDDADPSGANWIEPDDDTILDKVEWRSANVASSDYLVPQDLSAMTSAGAGGGLPTYVGAVPPQGVQPWDWQKTWDSRHAMQTTPIQSP